MSNRNNNAQIPAIRPTQFGGGSADLFKDSVNLFRGDVNLSLDLVSLTGRNGLDIKVNASYNSNIKNDIDQSNVSNPTGILGLGWNIGFERIEVDQRDSGTMNDNRYFLYANNTSNELVRNNRSWQRASLVQASAATLNRKTVDQNLITSLQKHGIQLGAQTSVEVIEQDKKWNLTDHTNQTLYTVEKNGSELAVMAGGESYECYQYDFSQIRYYPEFERWELIKDDGTINYFGGLTTEEKAANTIQWKVKWGNWTGQTDRTAGQSRFPVAWNLATVKNIWDDTISFAYEVVEQQVGTNGETFTKACYLSKITDMFKRTIAFNYDEKDYVLNSPSGAREYMAINWNNPYTERPNNNPSPYQDRYETKFLKNLTVKNEQNQLLYTVELDYDKTSNFTGYSNTDNLYGDTVKRTLTGIRRIFKDNCAQPGLVFSYWPKGSVNAGALNSAITPEGAVIDYHYKQQEIPLCDRQMQIQNPWPGVAKPRVWFGGDYVFTAWMNESTGQIKMNLYTWIGRWQEWSPATPVITTPFDISTANAVASGDFVTFSFKDIHDQKSVIYAFHKNNLVFGEWLETSPIRMGATKISVEAGDNFFLACDQTNRKLFRYTWNEFSREWIFSDQTSALSTNPNAVPYITATNKHYAILDYMPLVSGERPNKLTLYYQDGNYEWNKGGEKILPFTIGGSKPDTSFGFTTSSSFIALTYITQEVSLSFNYTVKVVSWDQLYNNITAVDFGYQLPKSNPSKTITIPFIAGFVSNSMIGSGPYLMRYNGEQWLQNKNLWFRNALTDADISWFAYGTNYAIFTSNRESACDSKLLSFDASINSSVWNNQPVNLFSTSNPTPNRKTHYFPTAGTDIATMGNRVYSRKSQTNWDTAVGTYAPLSEDINSTTMINQGPRFLSFLNMNGDTPVNSTILPLLNQQLTSEELIPQRYFTTIDKNGIPKQFTNGQYPAGPSSLVTSLPLNQDFDQATSITLHRYLEGAMEGKLVDYCVDYTVFNGGYELNKTKYEFDIASATCDPSGSVFKYYKSRFYPGTDNAAVKPFGYTENSYFNGLSSANGQQNKKASALLDGQLIERKIYNSAGALLVSETMEMESFTSVTIGGTTYNLFGGYTRCLKNSKVEDGLQKATNYVYEAAFGKLQLESFDNVTATGETETINKSYTYAFEAYPWFLSNNVIDVPLTDMNYITIKAQSNKQLCTGASFQAYNEWISPTGVSVWCTNKSYVLQQEIPVNSLNIQQLTQNTPGPEWRLINTVLKRTNKGAIDQQEDNTGKVETVIWDKSDSLPVAYFGNKGADEAYFAGFESYEKYASEWTTPNPIESYIVNGDAHAGNSSFKLTAGTLLQKTAPLQQSQTAIVSAWIKAEKGFLADSGVTSFIVKSGNTAVSTLAMRPQAEEVWEYWQGVVEFSGTAGRAISLSVKSDKSSKYLLINNICFSPLVGELTAKFYDITYKDETVQLGKNGDTLRYAYDPFRQKSVEAGPNEDTKKGAFSFATRAWQPVTGFTFPKDTPNSSTEILAGKGGLFETFTKGEQIWKTWQTAAPANWTTVNGSLQHTGTSNDQINWVETANSANYGCSFSVTSPQISGITFGFSIGSKLAVTWHPENGWSMTLDGTTYQNANVNSKVPVNIALVPISDAVLLYADGRQVLSQKTTAVLDGKLSLTAAGTIAFTNVATYNSPQVSMQFTNGSGVTMQSQVLDETRCLVRASLYNALGQTIVDTKIAAYDGELFSYRSGFITSFNQQTGALAGYVNDYYPADQGYPYSGTLYEQSSLGRMIKKGLPGKEFAITDTNAHVTKQQYGVETQTSVAGIPFIKGSFTVMATTDANGCSVYSMYDRAGNALGKQTNSNDGSNTVLQAAQQVYDYAGNVSEIRTPNYFGKTGVNPAFVTKQTFNFLHEMSLQQTTDSGEQQFIYDLAGRIRFCQNQLSKHSGSILYKKYDTLGRITEEGMFAGEWGDGKALQAIADTDPNYPQSQSWDVQNTYDGDGTDVALLGRIWKAKKSNPAGGIIENNYGYDASGNTNKCSLLVSDKPLQETHYLYDNLGNITEITYPNASKVVYSYNLLGQNSAIGTPEDPAKYALYTYNAGGSLANEQINHSGAKAIKRAMTYTSPGWIDTIHNEFAGGESILRQTFGYTSGGYENAGYFNGNIAKITTENGIDAGKSFDYKYKYDQRGQLVVAQHSKDNRYSLGITAPTSFDPNGNIETISQGAAVKTYGYLQNTNKVTRVSVTDAATQNYGYDAGGNIQSSSFRGINSINYSALNNLPVNLSLSGNTIDYSYNAQNQRVIKQQSAGGSKVYVHGLNEYPLLEITDTTVQYIYGIGGLLAMIKDGEIYFILKDQQGSTRAVIADNGTVESMLDYMPFGQLIETGIGNSDFIDYKFTGQELDTETGLYNYRARFYDPELGRFYSIDPKFQYGSPFVYCANNPLNLMDANGEDFGISFLIVLLIGAAIGAAVGGGVAAYTGYQAGLRGGALAGYIFAGAGIGAVAGALSAAGGVGAFAAGTAAAAGATTTAGGIAAGVAAGAAVGAVVGAGVGAAQGVSQHFVNDAFGVANAGSWQNSMLKGSITGAIGGAIAGGVAGAGGAIAVQQAARFQQATGASGWYQNAAGNATRATQIIEAYSSFKSMAVIPLPSFLGRIPSVGVQSFIYSKFSLPTLTAGISAGVKAGVGKGIDAGFSSSSSSSTTSSSQNNMPQNTFNPSTSNTVALQTAMIINPSYWKNMNAE
ncbi:MAG: RHS repeat-associated core domain-containing protein [Bacteroidota bacterium]